MQIKWVQVKNFRSIKDSGKIFLDSNMTILAGKNESGKSNILKALVCFSNDKFEDEDYPQDVEYTIEELKGSGELDTQVTVCYQVKKDLLKTIDKIHPLYEQQDYELIITRYGNYHEDVSGSAIEAIKQRYFDKFNNIDKKMWDLIINEKIKFPKLSGPIDSSDEENIEKYLKLLSDVLESLGNYDNSTFKEEFNKYITSLETLFTKEITEYDSIITSEIPKFVLFDSFNDLLPDSIESDEDISKIVSCFFKLAKIDNPSKLFDTTGQVRRKLIDKISAEISGDFREFYTQSEVKLKIDLDGDTLFFYIYDKNEAAPFKPNQRSKGFQWFLSFFLTINAEGSNSIVILIDEPGLYLHARAQEDVLKVLHNLSLNQQIILTTHSPYLIDPSRLERIRLISRNEKNNTFAENKIHKGADKDTLTPIITSIGLDLTRTLTTSANNNIIVEGISDYYYLEAFCRYFEKKIEKKNFNIIPSVGASQIPNIVSLLIGWGLNFKIILDNDSEGKRTENTLLSNLDVEENDIIFISEKNNYAIEDLFSIADFNKYVILEENSNDQKNSLRAKKLDKVLLAKSFNESIDEFKRKNIKFDKETTDNFINLINTFAPIYQHV